MDAMKVFDDSIKTSECINVMVHVGCVLSVSILFRSTPTVEQIKIALEKSLSLWSKDNPLTFEVSMRDGALYANAIKVEYRCNADTIYEN